MTFFYGFCLGCLVTGLTGLAVSAIQLLASEKKRVTRLVNKDEDDDYGMIVPYIPEQD